MQQKGCHVNTNQEKNGVVVLSDRLDFRAKNVTRDKEYHFTMIKGLLC